MRLSAFFFKERKKERKRKGKERKIVFRVYNPKIFASLLKLLFFIKKGRVSLSLLFLITHTHHPSEKRRAVLGEKRERTERKEASNKEETFLVRFFPLPLLKQTQERGVSRVFNSSSSSSSSSF